MPESGYPRTRRPTPCCNRSADLGGHAEPRSKVYFVKQLKIQKGAEGDAATPLVAMMREYTVFNIDQCETLTDSVKPGSRRAFANPTVATTLSAIF